MWETVPHASHRKALGKPNATLFDVAWPSFQARHRLHLIVASQSAMGSLLSPEDGGESHSCSGCFFSSSATMGSNVPIAHSKTQAAQRGDSCFIRSVFYNFHKREGVEVED